MIVLVADPTLLPLAVSIKETPAHLTCDRKAGDGASYAPVSAYNLNSLTGPRVSAALCMALTTSKPVKSGFGRTEPVIGIRECRAQKGKENTIPKN